MAELLLPDPSMVLLVGAAGAGKSTFAARHFAAAEVLSSDALRAAIGGDEANQAVSRLAFAALFRELDRRLEAGLLTVVDATNAARAHRAALLRRAAVAGVPAVAIVLALPATVVLARNAGRVRRVDEDVVRRQLDGVADAARPGALDAEGFAAMVVLRTPDEVAGLEVRRLPARPGRATPRPMQ